MKATHLASLTLIGAALLASAGSSAAGIVTPPSWGPGVTASTCPSVVRIVGMAGGTADTTLGRTVVRIARFMNPLAGLRAVFDFSAIPGLHLESAASWNVMDEGVPSVDCANRTVSAISNTDGYADVVVAGYVTSMAPGATPTVPLFCDGVPWGNVPVVAYDLDGRGGVGAGDLSIWLDAFGSGGYYGLLDYDQDGRLGAGDLSLWLDTFGSGRSAQSVTSTCP